MKTEYPMRSLFIICLSVFTFKSDLTAQSDLAMEAREFHARRTKMMEAIPDGILLLHARSAFANEDQLFIHGFQQEPSFYYFSGLGNAVGAILAIDGITKKSTLFVPTKLTGLAGLTSNAFVKPGPESAEQLLVDEVRPWEEFSASIDRRREEHPSIIIYTEQRRWGGTAQSNPDDLPAIDDPLQLWPQTLKLRWPGAEVKSASAAIMELRSVKSAAEVAVMRRVAQISAEALKAGVRGIRVGRTQRDVEAEVVCQCIASGGEGPSFWPWVMSGPNARIKGAMESLVDYRHANRLMKAGELVRVDVGCDADFYKGDVGRTVPVSGIFTADQREVWDLLVAAYHAGIAVMRDGVTKDSVANAAIAAAKSKGRSLTTPLGKKAAQMMINRNAGVDWHLHLCGLEAGEPGLPVLRTGMIIAFEPMVEVDGQAFYLEDMILITRDGYEILTKGLPASSAEIETFMTGS